MITVVGIWSLSACILSGLYAIIPLLSSGKSEPLISAAQAYISVGLLGVCVYKILKSQERRISQLERILSDRS